MRDQIQARIRTIGKKDQMEGVFLFLFVVFWVAEVGGRVCMCVGMISLISKMKGTVSGRTLGGRSRRIKS